MSGSEDERENHARAMAEQIGALLDDAQRSASAVDAGRARDLVRLLMELYGAALARIVRSLDESEVRARLISDDLVANLLILHGLHPDPLATRVNLAAAALEPMLAKFGRLRIARAEADQIHLVFEPGERGPAGASRAVRLAITRAIEAAAPEAASIVIDGLEDPPPQPQPLKFIRSAKEAGFSPARG